MARIKYDVSDVESRSGDHAKVGTYTVAIRDAEQRTEKTNGDPANDIHLTLEFVDEDYVPVHTYIGLSQRSDWKRPMS